MHVNMCMECLTMNGKKNIKSNYEKKRVLFWRIRKIIWRKDKIVTVSEILYGWVNSVNVYSSFIDVFCFKISKLLFMKLNAVKVMIITSLIIIILYTLGLFLPIIKNTKSSKIENFFTEKVIISL